MDTMTKTTALDISQLQLREITRDDAALIIPERDLEGIRADQRAALGNDRSLGNFLSVMEQVYPTAKDYLTQHRLAPKEHAGDKHYANHAYGLFMPGSDRPEVVVYTQLTQSKAQQENGSWDYQKLPNGIDICRDYDGRPEENPNTMIFFSISNMARTKANGSLGKELITRIGARVQGDEKSEHFANDNAVPVMPEVRTLTTLSPITGFNQWLYRLVNDSGSKNNLLLPHEIKQLEANFKNGEGELLVPKPEIGNEWLRDSELKTVMEKLCVAYLNSVKTPPKPKAKDQLVLANDAENFHVAGNGALLANLHFGEDTSDKGMENALGMMANFLYDDPERLKARAPFARNYLAVPMAPHLSRMLAERDQEVRSLGHRARLAANPSDSAQLGG